MKKRNFIYLIIGFSLALMVMSILSIISYKRLTSFILYSDQIEHTFRVLDAVERVGSSAREAESSLRGYVLTRDSSYLTPLFLAHSTLPQMLDSLAILVREDKMQTMRLSLLRHSLYLRLNVLESTIPMVNDGTYDSVIIDKMAGGRRLMEDFKEVLNQMTTAEKKLLTSRFRQKEMYQQMTPYAFRQVFIVVGLVSLLLFILLLRELFERIKSQQTLQQQVMALKQSYAELAQLAFAASHDLQEPVRKIRMFTDRVVIKQKDRLDSEGQMLLGRLDASASRLQGMLEDISDFMTLVDSSEEKELVSLNKIIEEVIDLFDAELHNKLAKINISPLPVLEVYPSQVRALFRAMIDNSLKFAHPMRPPQIDVTSRYLEEKEVDAFLQPHLSKAYLAITISDNGIGFDNRFSEKIFQLFRRLHASDTYTGKGIGLAICQRVMANHNGFITAEGLPDKGASFTLFFPKA